jgi:hypothetical protein
MPQMTQLITAPVYEKTGEEYGLGKHLQPCSDERENIFIFSIQVNEGPLPSKPNRMAELLAIR